VSHQSLHRKVLITGASSGIGASTAILLAKNQFHVILVARRLERLKDLRNQIQESGGQVSIFQSDLSINDKRMALFSTLEENDLLPDILVNNAGMAWYGFFYKMPWDIATMIIQVNVQAAAHLTSLFLPHMLDHQYGHIINIGSIAGKLPEQGISIYSASKSFLDAFTTSLHRELKGTGVHSSVIRAGPVKTEFFDAARSLDNGGSVPAERFAIPAERVAESVWNLIRHPARFRYVPFYLFLSPLIEVLFSGIIDRIGPLLLRRDQ
jgi:short-subunit dehydrogenase